MTSEAGSIYCSRSDARTWAADTDVGGSAHMLFDHDRAKAGLWRADPGDHRGLVEVEIPARETILVVEGRVRVSIDRGAPYDLGPGDMLSIPERSLVGWDPEPDCLVFWTYC